MGLTRVAVRCILVLTLTVAAMMVFASPFQISYPDVAHAQGTIPSSSAPAIGNIGFLVMTAMMGITILITLGFSRYSKTER